METRTARGQMVYSSCKLQRLIMDNLIIHLAIGGKCKQIHQKPKKKHTHTTEDQQPMSITILRVKKCR